MANDDNTPRRDEDGPDGPASGRLRRLTKAALNADRTIGRVDHVAEGLAESIDDFDRMLEKFEKSIDRFTIVLDRMAGSLDSMEGALGEFSATQRRAERLLGRVDEIVATAGWVISPLSLARRGAASLGGRRESDGR